ncbi:MAG TPA: hypothetical protein VN829_08710, partial [Dongiaceae bacterium]|nr:hypothetical protein [Dongiaceae bacterium]
MDIATLTPQQLRNAADLQERVDALQNQLSELLGGELAGPAQAAVEEPGRPKNGRRKKRRRLSPEGRANIIAATKARWAARRMGKKSASLAPEPEQWVEKPKRERSAAHRKALSEAMKARWAKLRRAG